MVSAAKGAVIASRTAARASVLRPMSTSWFPRLSVHAEMEREFTQRSGWVNLGGNLASGGVDTIILSPRLPNTDGTQSLGRHRASSAMQERAPGGTGPSAA